MDEETDKAMQEVMSKHFKDCTIIAVAHRIRTIRNFDRIIVLSNGEIVEMGTPEELLKLENGVFRSLAVEQKCA